MRLSPRLGLVAIAAAVLPFAACGGSDLEKVDAEDWVADVCDRALDFDDDLNDAAADLAVIEDGDPDEIKDAIDAFVDDASDIIDEFVKDIEDIGQPDIEGGDQVIKAIRAHAKDEKDQLTKFKDEVNDLDDDDEDDFRDDVISVLEDTEDLDLRDRFEDIDERDVDDLIDEIDADSDCSSALFSS